MQSYNRDKVRLINVFVEHSIDVIFTICLRMGCDYLTVGLQYLLTL